MIVKFDSDFFTYQIVNKYFSLNCISIFGQNWNVTWIVPIATRSELGENSIEVGVESSSIVFCGFYSRVKS